MPKILLLNAGSSSVKWKLFEIDNEAVVAKGLVERMLTPEAKWEISYGKESAQETIPNLTYEQAAQLIITKLQELEITSLADIKAVGHRVVAGGHTFKQATLVDEEALDQIKQLSSHAPLHNPMEAKYIELMQAVMPKTPQYAVFDSRFFTDMPEVNSIYSLPYELTEKYGLRKYGEHGISHTYISKRAASLLGKDLADLKMITLHLGSGSSVAALKDGKAYDTSMGFTPLTGLTMGTRAGDLDPALVPFLMSELNLDAKQVLELFNSKSGLLGLSGLSADMRDIDKAIAAGNKRAELALEIFINRVVKYVGSFYAELGGLDVLVFAGGIGENNRALRQKIVQKLACLGIVIDDNLNQELTEGVISPADAKVTTLVVPTNEELAMVQEIKAVM